MSSETANIPEAKGRGDDQLVRLGRAGAVGLAAWWLVPRLFPYFDPQRYLDKLAGPSEWSGLIILGASLLPHLALGVSAYFYPSSRRTSSAAAGMEATPSALRRCGVAVLAAALAVGLVALAYAHRFVDDDAFISFRYARNLVEGHGLVYNPGERVEGYTNFLWVIIMAAGMRLGIDPVVFSHAAGLACFAGTLVLVWRMGRQVLPGAPWAVAAMLLAGTHYSVLAFATSGLETALVTLLLMAACCLVVTAHQRGGWRRSDLLGLSVVCALGILTRMDFAVWATVLMGAALISARPPSRSPVMLVGPAVVILAIWFAWKWCYYGAWLPNTYYAKQPGTGAVALGLRYLADFGRSYRFWLPGAVALAGIVQLVRQRHILLMFGVLIAAWLMYVAAVGGDFIEFRLLVPVIPFFVIWLVWTLAHLRWSHRFYLPVFVLIWTAHGSLAHLRTYGWETDRAEPVSHLRRQTTEAHWAEAGRALHKLFGGTGVLIATTAVGILPYYAGLDTLNMHGLTDAHVGRHGRRVNDRPGHKRIADEAYMRRRGVHLVIGHPKIEPIATLDELPLSRLQNCAKSAEPGTEADIVAIPISGREALLAWYLTPHPAIEEAIESQGWRLYSVTTHAPTEGG